MNSKFKVLDLAYIAVCAALMAVCAWINIPLPAVSFTLQILAVFFALTFLGGRKGTIAIVVYILLGAVGAPVFSGMKGGLAVLVGQTGGYIVGFVVMGLVYMLFEYIFMDKFKAYLKITAHVIGLLLCYVFGTVWFMVVYTNAKGPVSIITVLGWCVFPFIIPDLVKLALGFFLGQTVKKALEN